MTAASVGKTQKRFGQSAIVTPANIVTTIRILVAIPTLFLIRDRGSSWLTVGLWFAITASDSLDGWMARRDGATRSGAFLDPIADKVLTIGGLLVLVVSGAIWWFPVALIAARELFVSVYRSAAARRGISLPARQLGKWKAVLQMLAVGVYLFPPLEDMTELKLAILWIAVVFTIVSGIDIVRRGWREGASAG